MAYAFFTQCKSQGVCELLGVRTLNSALFHQILLCYFPFTYKENSHTQRPRTYLTLWLANGSAPGC